MTNSPRLSVCLSVCCALTKTLVDVSGWLYSIHLLIVDEDIFSVIILLYIACIIMILLGVERSDAVHYVVAL